MGTSSSVAQSVSEVDQTTVQQFAGTCDFKCNNSINGVQIDLVGVTLEGGLQITQQCSTDATCSISANMDAVSDVVAKANTSTNAKNTGEFLSGILNFDDAKSQSKVKINNYVQQKVFDECSVSSSNDIRNLSIFAANTDITGGIAITQIAKNKGNCSFNTVMKAVQESTAIAEATAISGKDKKGEKCGSCSGAQVILTYIGIGILVIIALGIIAYVIKRFATGSTSASSTSSLGGKSFWSSLSSKFKTKV